MLLVAALALPFALSPRPAVAQVDVNEMFQRAARLVAAGGLTRGREQLIEILEIDPFWSDIYREIGYLSMELSDPAECILYSHRYLAMEPEATDAREVRRRITQCEEMASETGVLQITGTVPERSLIEINGVAFGRGGTDALTLPIGLYTVTSEAIDHDPYAREVELTAGATESFVVELTAMIFQGQITVISEVAGAEVRLDGHSLGTTPLESPVQRDEGTYLLEVIAPGYHPWRRNVEFVRDDNMPIDVRLIDESVDLSEFY